MKFEPRNILVIDFGQLGDVVLSLPALGAIRRKFPRARITVAVGKSAAPVVEMSGYANDVLPIDRVALRDGAKPLSIFRIARLVKDVRRARFDFVIDLHSLSETNLLGFLSGAPMRLYSRRRGRSLDFLSNFRPQSPFEDSTKHAVERYLDVLAPLGVERDAPRTVRLRASAEDERIVERILTKEKANTGAPLIGMFPGAGHESRRWPLARFAELADYFWRNDCVRTLVFIGPEERTLAREMRAAFGSSVVFVEGLTLPQLAAALARLSVFVSNDTGPVHIAAAMGTPTVVVVNRMTPDGYAPLGENHRVIYSRALDEISVEKVYEAARSVFTAERTATIFAN